MMQPKVMSGEVGEISEEVQKDEVEFEVDRGGDNGSGSLDIVSVGELSIDSASNGKFKFPCIKDEVQSEIFIRILYCT